MPKWMLAIFISFFCLVTGTSAVSAWLQVSADPGLNEYASSSFLLQDGRICVVFENVPSFSPLVPPSQIMFTCQDHSGIFQKAKTLQPGIQGQMVYTANARPLNFKGIPWIYFNAYDGVAGRWGRFVFDEANPAPAIEWLQSPESLKGQTRAWIFPVVTPQNDVMLAYERRKAELSVGELRFARSADGVSVTSSRWIADKAQMIRVGFFRSGVWAFVYQVGYGAEMMDYLVFSSDEGNTFGSPVPVSSQKDLHDPFLLLRKDGDLDVYYLVWQSGSGFALFRRHVFPNGSFGAEQRLSQSLKSVDKPYALRLVDGSIFLTVDNVVPTVNAVTTDIIATVLKDDAL